MAEQWIPAAQAAKLVTEGPSGPVGHRALCARAHRGLAPTQARLLVLTVGNLVSRSEQAPVPTELWDAEGAAGVQQDWNAGDFSAILDDGRQVQAFGVTFALSGLLELLPVERRATAARSLSVAGNPAWVTARAACAFAFSKAGLLSATSASAGVLDHARLGFVLGRAVLAQRFDGSTVNGPARWERGPHWEAREWDIPTSFWREFKVGRQGVYDWERGLFAGEGPGPCGPCLMRLEGVHFLAESLEVLLPAHERKNAPAAGPKAQGKGGGQPARAFWDEMLCDIGP